MVMWVWNFKEVAAKGVSLWFRKRSPVLWQKCIGGMSAYIYISILGGENGIMIVRIVSKLDKLSP